VLVARWLGLPAGAGQHFLLDTGTLSVLAYYRGIPALKTWNAPLGGYVGRSLNEESEVICTATTPSEDAWSSSVDRVMGSSG